MNKFIIDGAPIPLKRHRTGRDGIMYDPQSSLKEDIFNDLSYQIKAKNIPLGIINSPVPIRMDITFYMPIPASYPQKKKDSLRKTYHYKKPDLSNLVKFYEDAANSLLFRDDSQIAVCTSIKIYDTYPRTEIIISPLSTQAIETQ